jgi:hypothetical protein
MYVCMYIYMKPELHACINQVSDRSGEQAGEHTTATPATTRAAAAVDEDVVHTWLGACAAAATSE